MPLAGAHDFLVERLVGDTGAPDSVTKAARGFAERALKALENGLNEHTAWRVPVELASVDVDRTTGILADAHDNDAVTIASASNSPDALTMRLDARALAVFIDAMFGADPDEAPNRLERELSAVELDIAAMMFRQAASAFNGDGVRAMTISFPLPHPLTGEALGKLRLRDGPAARLEFGIGRPPHVGKLTVVMPQRVLLRPRGPEQAQGASPAADAWTQRFGKEIMRSTVRLEAAIPAGKMTLAAIAGLKRGQVIELPENAAAQTRLSARNKTLFVCEFGRLGQNYTVRIKDGFHAGDEPADDLASR